MNTVDNLPTVYDPRAVEPAIREAWLSGGYFHADPAQPGEAYAIVIPPPNVTGALHGGHALNNTLQDILIRWRRMQGFNTLWMPGTDHAGIATQAVVEKRVFETEKKSRHDLGRDELVRRIWDWKEQYGNRIIEQLKLMGCSCDWDRIRFTLDEVCARAVRHTFFRLFKDGLIVRGKRLVNWDTQLQTAVADDEVYHEAVKGHLWHIRYPLKTSARVMRDGRQVEITHLIVATTRPETMLGDTAVAVHPQDERWKPLIGQSVILPLLNREIPVVADPVLVSMEFGTGCVKVTPAHDPNDYQSALRNGLEMINILTPDGRINTNGGPYEGLGRYQARERVVADLEAQGLIERIEDHEADVGHSDRSKTPIEPYLSDQWFVRMGDLGDEAAQIEGLRGSTGLAQLAMDAVCLEQHDTREERIACGKVHFFPARYAKTYLDWLGEKRDWCISRQLWWGHRIPIWYCSTCSEEELMQAFAGREDVFWRWDAEKEQWLVCADQDNLAPNAVPGHVLTQDPDVLDTWFSSALWPHSTLGWPEATPELSRYYPGSVLSTAREIITLWVARMVLTGRYNLGEIPFTDVYIHAVIQDAQGRPFKKTLGNGFDPVDIIESYGADALRFTMATCSTETQDIRMPMKRVTREDGRELQTSERFELGRNFCNKVWNAARFAFLTLSEEAPLSPRERRLATEAALEGTEEQMDLAALPIEDRWILSRVSHAAADVQEALERFQFSRAAATARDFFWDSLCDWYLELVKLRVREHRQVAEARRVLAFALDQSLRLLHPFIPYITERLWAQLNAIAPERDLPGIVELDTGKPLVTSSYPPAQGWPELDSIEADAVFMDLQTATRAVRDIRQTQNVAPRQPVDVTIRVPDERVASLQREAHVIKELANVGQLVIDPQATASRNAATLVIGDMQIFVLNVIDPVAERARLEKELVNLDRQIAGIQAKLGNEGFVSRAPADVVQQQRDKLSELQGRRDTVARSLADLG